ncbi:MAG: hypothetical protein K2N16_07195 [Muribaculaceae bacterium]|nr:hypothetical protein [Muribaculaceae bacterium]
MRLRHIFSLLLPSLALFLSMCSPSVPSDFKAVSDTVSIYPDYADITIPSNIAPLNFKILSEADDYVVHAHPKGQDGLVVKGPVAQFDVDKWHGLLEQCVGDTLLIDVYAKADGQWLRHPAMRLAVAEEIDPYISYRQIEPSYIGFEEMRICQRDLRSFDEEEVFNNCLTSEDENGQCINCHSYQDYNRQGNMQMHVRINHGGTVIVRDGKAVKVDLKTPQTISAGVYPSWHPTLPLIAYSNNTTTQNFHENHPNKVEVQDGQSDIILYDVENNKVQIIENSPTELESFPYWSPDGRTLYYVSAAIPYLASDSAVTEYKATHYRDYKYNIYKKSFDPETRQFGPTDTVFMASSHGASATFPRVSPDGKYLMFTLAPYGTFHIWHKDADLFLMDLATGGIRPMKEINSKDVDSYHSFSSNGRWVIFSTRRDDGSYTRLYLTHFGPDGHCTKPFILPQRAPAHNPLLYKYYNIPEFMVAPVSLSRQALMDVVASDPIPAQ